MITKFSTSKLSYNQRYHQMMAGSVFIANGMELISTQVLASTATSVTFSSIPQTYRHLQIVSSVNANTGGNVNVTWNGSTGYTYHDLRGNGVGVQSTNATGANGAVSIYGSAQSDTNYFAGMILDLLDYTSTTKNKTMKAFAGIGGVGNKYTTLTSGVLFSTTAVTSITYAHSAGTFSVGSRFSLYGWN